MKSLYIPALVAVAAATFTGCSSEEELMVGEGRVMIRTTLNGDFEARSSRASSNIDELSRSCILWISNSNGVVRHYTGLENVPADGIWLTANHYLAEAWAGDSVPASFTDRWFKGAEGFDVRGNSATQVDLVCKIANVAASVKYAPSVSDVLDDCTVTVGHSAGELTYTADETRRGYFMMPTASERALSWSVSGTTKSGETFTKTGTIANVKEATEYIITVNYDANPDISVGGGFFTIEVDENPLAEEITDIVITLAPSITGVDFDINTPIVADPGEMTEKAVKIGAAGKMTSVVVACDRFTELGLGANSYDLLDQAFINYIQSQLADEGIRYKYVYDEQADASAMKVIFEASLLNKMGAGAYPVTITATDSNGKTTTRVMDITIGKAKAVTTPIAADSPAIWATTATLSGTVGMEDVSEVGFNYRAKGATEWTYVQASTGRSRAAIAIGSTFTATLSGLTPGTEYEYQAVGDGEPAAKTYTFVTEAAPQLPNSSFEEWSQPGKVLLLGADENNLFWDSGNHGSSTMNKNVTSQATSPVHSGTYSAYLKSQFVGLTSTIGKFAAGNAFVGKYLKTEGTDGILGFGQPFTSRPKAVKIWVKYIPAAIEYPKSNFPDYLGIAKGDMDQGSIYVAMFNGEETLELSSSEKYTAACIVRTKQNSEKRPSKLFDRNAANVIAYGDHYFTEATPGDGLVQIEIPLEYSKDSKATHIAVVCAASRYGDYFAGGNSEMWIDDVELVY